MFSNHPQQPKQPLPQYSGREYIMLQLRNIGRREPAGLPPMVFCLLENGWHSGGFHASGRKLCRCLSEYIFCPSIFRVIAARHLFFSAGFRFAAGGTLVPFENSAANNAAGRGRGDSPSTTRPLSHGGNIEGRDRPRMDFLKLSCSRKGGFSRHINSGGIKR